ncbi:hypothetical protein [Pseudomonas sp. TWP3-2]|uniref:hypothetical protein n=1 Tax=Pseudomonas sp. TWP3-2 TaxID=2804574 RepID=UPI003CF47C99
MSHFKTMLLPVQLRRLHALDSWYRTFENCALRMDCPDSYHEELLRQADEMDRKCIVDWDEWRELRVAADQAYLRAVAGEDYQRGEQDTSKED